MSSLAGYAKSYNTFCFGHHIKKSISINTERRKIYADLTKGRSDRIFNKLKNPSKMMFSIMKLHTVGLKDCHGIDLWGQPIQMSGIPILCTEIPDLMFDLNVPELTSKN